MENELHCEYVSTGGLYLSCDIILNSYNSTVNNIDEAIQKINSSIQDYIKVYIQTQYINEFSYKIHLLQKPVIIVSGHGDYTIPNDIPQFQEFINHPQIIHYYAQNCVLISHPKVSQIPIGMDYHTLQNREHWWGAKQSAKDQDAQLIQIRNESSPFYKRKMACYSNFHFVDYGNKFGYSRKDVIDAIPKELIYYEPVQIDRKQSWKNQSEYAFIVSPFGNGLDCHRTWEALVLGCIVIVKKSPLDPLYEGLPVLIVEEWTDITKELLEKTIQVFCSESFDYSPLTLDYWKKTIDSSLSKLA
jgi:hypothetical protein